MRSLPNTPVIPSDQREPRDPGTAPMHRSLDALRLLGMTRSSKPLHRCPYSTTEKSPFPLTFLSQLFNLFHRDTRPLPSFSSNPKLFKAAPQKTLSLFYHLCIRKNEKFFSENSLCLSHTSAGRCPCVYRETDSKVKNSFHFSGCLSSHIYSISNSTSYSYSTSISTSYSYSTSFSFSFSPSWAVS